MGVSVERDFSQALDKARGTARYAGDVRRPGTLAGAVLRSPLPHARIASIDVSAARALPGVRAVLIGDDLPADMRIGRAIRDMPVLARDRVRFVGEKVAAVAADTTEIAEEAVERIEVAYEELSAVFDPLEAVRPDAPAIHETRDIAAWAAPRQVVPDDHPNGVSRLVWGKAADLVAEAIAASPHVVAHTFRTPVQHQAYLEPHACTVEIDRRGRVHVWATNKAPFLLSSYLHDGLGLDPKRLKVHVMPIGGDFGGKGSPMDIPLAYLLARETGRPVRFVVRYTDEMRAANPRHAAVVHVRSGVDHDGRVLARLVRVHFASGAYAAFKPSPDAALPNIRAGASGPYEIPMLRIESEVVYTNTVPSGHMRNPGQAQTTYAIECHMDLIAAQVGLDPVALRRRNAIATRSGSTAEVPPSIDRLLDEAARTIGWHEPRPPNVGRGVALAELHASPGIYSAALELRPDGRVTFRTPVVDNGAGMIAAFRILIADRLRVPLSQVRIQQSTAGFDVDRGVGGSRVTRMVGILIDRVCAQLLKRLAAHVTRALGRHATVQERELRLQDGSRLTTEEAARLHGRPVTTRMVLTAGEQDSVNVHAVQAVEVHVDPETGSVRPTRIVSVHEAGRILDRDAFEGQIRGGAIQGLGFALMEGLEIEDGVVMTANLHDYKIPTAMDVPPIETIVVSDERLGITPIGEGAVGVAPAIANAVADAVSAEPFDLPIKPEEVFRRMQKERNFP